MIYCSLKLVEAVHSVDNHKLAILDHRNKYVLLFKKVDWPFVPIPKNPDMRISLGRDAAGEETGWSIIPNAVWFDVNGDIIVDLSDALLPEVDPFDTFVQYAKNDGFVEYQEWKSNHGT